MTKNSTILPKKPKTGQTYDNYTDLNAQQNPQISNISKKSNFTNFNNSQGKAPQTTQFSSNSLSSANLQKTSLTGLQNNSSQNYGQIAKIPVPIKSSNFTNNSAITAQNTQSFQSESSVKNSNNSTKILQNQPEIKPFIRQNQSKLQEKIYIGETQKVNWTESLKAKIDKSGKELEVLKNLENSYKLPSFDQKQEKNTQNETFQEFRHDDYNNQNIENRQIPERLQNKILETVDEKLDKIHQTGQEWRQNQENVTSQNNLQNGAANQASNSINSSSQVIGFGQNSTKPTNTNLQTENQLKNPRIEQNLQRIKETGEQNRQKLELEKLAKINSQGLLQKIDPKNTKLESVINSGKSVISKQNFTEYLENLQNNSQNSQIEKNGQNDNLQTLQKSQTQKNTNNQPQIGAKIGISQQDSQKNLETKVITTSLPKTSPNFEQNSQENRVEKNLENLEIAKTSNQNENSNNLGLALGNKEIKSTTLVEKSQEIGQKIELEKPKSFIEKLNQIKNNALKKIGITSISRTSLNLANTGIIGLNDGLTTELNLRGNLQEDFEASKILRLLQALAFSTGKNGQENLINKLGQFDGPFFELNPAFPFGGSNNLFATFSALLERNQQFLALICKKEITKENREKYLTVIKNHLKDKENQRFWATLLFVSYQSGNEAIVFGPLALLTGNYTKLPFVNNLIKKAYGIFDGLETTASGETRNFASDFEAQIRKKYDEIKLKET